MAMLLSTCLTVLAGLLVIPVVIFCIEVIAATLTKHPRAMPQLPEGARPKIAVVIPAHNESAGLLATLENVKAQLLPSDRVVVVADNCTDDTASVASAAGAEVSERKDPARRGKGYALDWGLRYLAENPPEVVVFVDADCKMADGALNELASACVQAKRPTQALYLMNAPDGSSIDYRVAEFAWRIKNWMRPLGLATLHLPCQLMGTGMAFPWGALSDVNLASGEIVEDLKLGLDLARAGYPPLFLPAAVVSSQFAASARGAASQRSRWERGHLVLILSAAPRLFYACLSESKPSLLALTLDLVVPPLTLLGILTMAMVAISGFSVLLGGYPLPFALSNVCLFCYAAAIVACWLRCGRDILPPRAIRSIPLYVVAKAPLYRQIAFNGGEPRWIRTDRKNEEDPAK